ncbi:hypothetical protein cypCar_00024468, partial [Cyprinus carpio]
MPEPSQDFVPGNQFRVPASPSQTHHSNKQAGGPWKRDTPSHTDGPRLTWNGLHHFHLQGMDLQGMSVPNMLGQDGGLLTNSLSV